MFTNLNKEKIVACLDIGSSKIVCLIASINSGEIEVLGYGHTASRGIVSGAISDMDMAQKAITTAISEAERVSKINIDEILVAVSGELIFSRIVDVTDRISAKLVKSSDIIRLASKVRDKFCKKGREVIHLIPIQYKIDDSVAIANPRNMSGEMLHANFYVASISSNIVKNIESCLRSCQLSVSSYIAEPYSSAIACLTEVEMSLGSVVIDIGSSSTSYAVIFDGKLIHIGSIRMGGFHITKDIATIMGISIAEAEQIKSLNSSLILSPLEEREFVIINSGRELNQKARITHKDLKEIMQSRIEEIFENTKKSLDDSKINSFSISNIVLTGGVSSIIGIEKVAYEIFKKNIKVGYPIKIKSMPSEIANTANSCAIGMLNFSKFIYLKENSSNFDKNQDGLIKRIINKIISM